MGLHFITILVSMRMWLCATPIRWRGGVQRNGSEACRFKEDNLFRWADVNRWTRIALLLLLRAVESWKIILLVCVAGHHLLQSPSLQCVCQWPTSTHLQTSLHTAERHWYFGDYWRSAADFSAGLTGIRKFKF